MPSLELQVSANLDDSTEVAAGTNNTGVSSARLRTATHLWTAQAWVVPDIPQGATIVGAHLQLWCSHESRDDIDSVFYGEAADSATTLVASDSFISDLPRTTASVAWDEVDVGGGSTGWKTSPDIKTIIQEIVNRPSWAPGNRLCIIGNAISRDFQYFHRNGSITEAPKLLIEYADLSITGQLVITLADAISEAIGELAITGTLSATLEDASLDASGALAILGALAATLDDADLSATGVLVSGNTGSLSATLDDATLSAFGELAITGVLNATLEDATLDANGALELGNSGVLVATLEDAILDAAGALALSGALVGTLEDASLAAFGGLAITGELSATLDDATVQAQGFAVLIVAIVHSTIRGSGGSGFVRGAGASGTVQGGDIVGQVKGQ